MIDPVNASESEVSLSPMLSNLWRRVFELEPTLNDPIPPEVRGFGPSIPPIPAILPCFASRVGPFVTGTNADECATRKVTAIHLNAPEENIFVVKLSRDGGWSKELWETTNRRVCEHPEGEGDLVHVIEASLVLT
eukprot:CCRYP_018439-RA/>CCRYP_018439-RA protein AED:0.43 eAED:1.00 QI:0/0/0/1/0/0/2/0/134